MIRIGDLIIIDIDGYECRAVVVEKKALPIPKETNVPNFDEEWYS